MFGLVDVTTRPAPGPVRPALLDLPHFRMPDDPAFCVCGEVWVQAMTCHPCRMPDHLAAWCVDGPGRIVPVGADAYERHYPDRSAGRWCMCSHSPTAGGTLRFADLSDAEVREVTAEARLRTAKAERAARGMGAVFGPMCVDGAPVPEVRTAAEAAAVGELIKGIYGGEWSAAEALAALEAEQDTRRRREAWRRGLSASHRVVSEITRAQARARHLMGEGAAGLYEGERVPPAGGRFCGDVPPC